MSVNFRQFYLLTEAVNQGDVFEFVFAAACVARFIARTKAYEPKPVTPELVSKVMDNYFNGSKAWKIAGPKDSSDIVTFKTANIPNAAMQAISKSDYRQSPDVLKMINSAIKAVEMPTYKIYQISQLTMSNGKNDTIEIIPIGKQDQSGTKSDVDIVINNKIVKRISLKYKSITFGQFAGTNIQNQVQDALANVGIKVSKMLLSALDAEALRKRGLVGIYKSRQSPQIAKDKELLFKAVGNIFDNVKRTTINIDSIIKGFTKAVQGTEPDLSAVAVGGSGVNVLDKQFIQTFKNKLKKNYTNLKWVLSDMGSNPTLLFTVNNTPLFKIRFRFDADKKTAHYKLRTRTYLEIFTNLYTFVQQSS